MKQPELAQFGLFSLRGPCLATGAFRPTLPPHNKRPSLYRTGFNIIFIHTTIAVFTQRLREAWSARLGSGLLP